MSDSLKEEKMNARRIAEKITHDVEVARYENISYLTVADLIDKITEAILMERARFQGKIDTLVDALKDSLCTCHPPSDHVCKRCEALIKIKREQEERKGRGER